MNNYHKFYHKQLNMQSRGILFTIYMYAYFYCRLRAKASTCFIVLANVKQSLSTQAAHLLFLYAALAVFGFRATKLCLPATATVETVICKRQTYMYMGRHKFNTRFMHSSVANAEFSVQISSNQLQDRLSVQFLFTMHTYSLKKIFH